ncbi:MAG TPA: glycosyltransferase [Vicinamibacterales bacterium]|nr:glycosyltransferase [Vicinamibacterales bacterium]
MQHSTDAVCVITQSDYQADPRVRRKAEALIAAGYSVDVLALPPSTGKKSYTLNGVRVRTMPLGKKRGSLARYVFEYAAFFVWALVRVTLQMRRRRYAVVDVNTLPDFLIFAPAIARLMGARLVLDMHEITPEFYMSKYGISRNGWMVRLMTWLENRSMHFADHVMVINEPIQDLLVGRGLPRSKSTVVMNAADETRFTDDTEAPRVAAAVSRPRFVMMYHGTLTRTYGVDIAVEAFATVQHEMPGAEFWILGSGPEERSLQRLIDERGLNGRAKLLGPVPSREIPEWLRTCDAGILSMRRDALLDFASPNKLAEFIVSGRPVAISRLNATRYYFSETALAFFEPSDAADLARQMVRLYRDPALRDRLAEAARAEYRPIRWDVMRERYLDLIARAASASRARSSLRAADEAAAGATCTVPELWAMVHKAAAWLDRIAYASYDPYDVWGTRYGRLARRLYYRKHPLGVLMTAPVVLMEVLCPRLRAFLVRKNRFATADAQLALGFLNLHEISGSADWLRKARGLADDLLKESIPGYRGRCWGYPFDWQSVSGLMRKSTPHITATPYCYEVFTRLFDLTGEESYLEVARSIAAFVADDLHDTPTGVDAAASSYTPNDHSLVINASAYRAFVMFDAARRFQDDRYRAKAFRNLRFILDAQRADGAWLYALESPAEAFIDHFHTCFVLKNLWKINRHLHSPAVAAAVRKGYAWYREHLFDDEAGTRSFAVAPRVQIVRREMYDVAEAISLGVLLGDDIPGAFSLADRLAATYLRQGQHRAGHWITRQYIGGITHRVPFIRWPQSQLFLAATNLLAAKARAHTASERSHVMTLSKRSAAPVPAYVLVTAAKNEAEFIERTIRSVVTQTVRPVKWVVVDDGSTDGTDRIVATYARDYPWIDLVRMPQRRERHFAGKADAFNAGRRHVASLAYDAIGNLDADVSFDDDYFEFLLGRLGEDPSLGVVGTAFEDTSLHYDYRFVSIEHVAGPLQLFRRECLDDIGGYVASRRGGVDHIAVITARMKGWKTRTFPGKSYRHHREMGTASRGKVAARFKSGALDYALGGHPVWEVCRTVYQMTKPPYVVGGLALLAGYLSACAQRIERPVAHELVRFRRREQMNRLKHFFAGRTAA